MLKAIAAIYLPTPSEMPARTLPHLTRGAERVMALVYLPGVTAIQPGEAFDPDVWNVSAEGVALLLSTGAAAVMPDPDVPVAVSSAADASSGSPPTASSDAKA